MSKKTIYSREHNYLIGRLKKARIEANLTQAQAGKMMGKDQTFISKVESGQYRVDAIQLCQFARIYKKALKYFVRN